jgi:Tfp pilus assembly protein PilW
MRATDESGFSLLELLLAALLTVGLLGAVFAITGKHQQVFVTESGVTDLNQNVRIAADFLTRDIQSAGMGLARPNACFAAIYYINGAGGAPDQVMIVNGDPYTPTVYINSQAGGASSIFSFVKSSDVTVTGSGSSAQFTYTDQHSGQTKNLYEVFSSANPKYYICYDDTKAVIFALTSSSQYTAATQTVQLTHDTSNAMNRGGIFGTTIDQLFSTPVDAGQPSYNELNEIAVLGSLIGYRINQATNELERTEDLNNWYTIARGITNLQIQYRTVTGTTANPINNIDEEPGDRKTIRSAIITISAQTPDMSPGDKGFRQAIQTFEVAPRNLNLLRNNNLTGNAKGAWEF